MPSNLGTAPVAVVGAVMLDFHPLAGGAD